MTLSSVARHLVSATRRHGVGAGVKLLSLAVARQAVTIERTYVLELTRPPPTPAARGRHVRLATPEDIHALANESIWDLERDAVELLERGHRCVLNVIDGEVAGYAWMNPHRMLVPRVRTALSLRPGEAHIYKGFTHPEHRGRNLGVDRFAFWLERLGEDERPRRLLTDFAFDNFSTLARMNRTGLTRVATATYVAWGRHERRLLTHELATRAVEPIPVDLRHRDH